MIRIETIRYRKEPSCKRPANMDGILWDEEYWDHPSGKQSRRYVPSATWTKRKVLPNGTTLMFRTYRHYPDGELHFCGGVEGYATGNDTTSENEAVEIAEDIIRKACEETIASLG